MSSIACDRFNAHMVVRRASIRREPAEDASASRWHSSRPTPAPSSPYKRYEIHVLPAKLMTPELGQRGRSSFVCQSFAECLTHLIQTR
jgi:hypothetical protein